MTTLTLGIFIVEANNSASEVPALRMGARILEVNEESLLGCTKSEAANILRKTTGTVRLLICEGFNPEIVSGRSLFTPVFELFQILLLAFIWLHSLLLLEPRRNTNGIFPRFLIYDSPVLLGFGLNTPPTNY